MFAEIRNPYQLPLRISLIAGLTLLAMGIATGWALFRIDPTLKSHQVLVILSMLATCVSIGLLVSALILSIISRRIATVISIIKNDDSLIHWNYSLQEWAAFQKKETQLSGSDFRRSPIFQFLPYLPVGILAFLLLAYFDQSISVRDLVITVIGVCVFFALMIPVSYYFRVIRVNARRRALETPSQSFLNLDYGYANGSIFFCGLFQQHPVRVQLLEDSPRCIEFIMRMNTPRTGPIDEVYRVLVPVGEEKSAEQYVARMRQAWFLD